MKHKKATVSRSEVRALLAASGSWRPAPQHLLARHMGMTQSTVSRLLSGEITMTEEHQRKLKEAVQKIRAQRRESAQAIAQLDGEISVGDQTLLVREARHHLRCAEQIHESMLTSASVAEMDLLQELAALTFERIEEIKAALAFLTQKPS
jgi:DNA-binding LacI/PurR family transcriptional regulator